MPTPAHTFAAKIEWPRHQTPREFAKSRGLPFGTVDRLLRGGKIPYVVAAHGVRLVHSEADVPVEPPRNRKKVCGGVPMRRCPVCMKWKAQGGFGPSQWRGSYGGACKPCMKDILAFRTATQRDPVLKAAYDLAMKRDQEIVSARSRGEIPSPTESRIQELAAWAAREGLAGGDE